MNENNHIKSVIWRFECRGKLTLEAIATDLEVVSSDSIMTMDKTVIKDIDKWLVSLVDSTFIARTRLDCGLHTMQAIDFLLSAVQDLSNCGLTSNVTLLHEIYTCWDNFYRSFQIHQTQTKSISDDSRVIYLLILKCNKMPNSTQFSYWIRNMASNLDGETSFYGFTPFSYMVK